MSEKNSIRSAAHSLFTLLRGLGLILLMWWIISLCVGERLFPSPFTVIPLFARLTPKTLAAHAAKSLVRIGAGLAASGLIALPLGIAMGRLKTLDEVLTPASYLLYPVPKIAFLPVVLLLAGLGEASKIIIVSLVLFFQVLVSVRDGAKNIEPEYIRQAKTLGAKPRHILTYVILPSLLPGLFSSLRVATGTAISVLFFAETFSGSSGLGFYIMDAWVRVAYGEMFAGILATALLGLGLMGGEDLLEWIVCPWNRKAA
jgi:NitT/TauT family transport system permease protein